VCVHCRCCVIDRSARPAVGTPNPHSQALPVRARARTRGSAHVRVRACVCAHARGCVRARACVGGWVSVCMCECVRAFVCACGSGPSEHRMGCAGKSCGAFLLSRSGCHLFLVLLLRW
jgi:hypothetical protein